MEKKPVIFLFCLVVIISIFGTIDRSEAKELKKFIRNENGELGYDLNQSVPLFKGASEIIDIPENYMPDKELFQSSWVATIQNLNFAKPKNQEEFQSNYLKVLDDFEAWNMNAMIFQVRPLLDSWYLSEYNPWSEFLSGTQGENPGYDPLPWMIEETHKKGMEYHAWLNPYRVSNTKFDNSNLQIRTGKTQSELEELEISELIELYNQSGILADYNYAVLHPDQVLIFEQKLFLNPGIPEVREYVFDTVDELVRKYDIDAIHFDDYFYPYRITVDGENVSFGSNDEDKETFETYGIGFSSIDDWRRNNIDLLAEGVKDTINQANSDLGKSVQFGISPFGIWEHIENDERGSHTPLDSSQTYSDSIFADTYKWVKEETVDYLVPQIYWSFDQEAAPYGELTKWWNTVADGTHTQIYVGHANYKHVNNGGWDVSWLNPEEIPNQLKFNTIYPNVKGSVLYSYSEILPTDIDSVEGVLKERYQAKNDAIEILQNEYFTQKLLVPAKPWLSQGDVFPPKEVVIDGSEIQILESENGKERFYIIYAGEGTEEEVISDGSNIIDRIYNDGSGQVSVTIPESIESNLFVTSTDAAGVESKAITIEDTIGKGRVVIEYLEIETNKILNKTVLEGEVNSDFTIDIMKFDSYEVIQPDFSLKGKYTDEEQYFSVFYKETTKIIPEKDKNPNVDEVNNSDKSGAQSKEQNLNKNLPKTGEKRFNSRYFVVGLLLLLLLGFIYKKKTTK